jgi:hypothetical protein
VVASTILSVSIGAAGASAQPSGMMPIADTIVRAEVGHQLGAFTADSMRGWGTPSIEVERTAAYVAAQFRRIGVVGQGRDSVCGGEPRVLIGLRSLTQAAPSGAR